jgi:hypothetical protein
MIDNDVVYELSSKWYLNDEYYEMSGKYQKRYDNIKDFHFQIGYKGKWDKLTYSNLKRLQHVINDFVAEIEKIKAG